MTATEPRPLTERQREIFEFIFTFTCAYGFQPAVREVMTHANLKSPNAVMTHLRAIQRKGWLNLGGSHSRAIRFLYTTDAKLFRGFEPITGEHDAP